jgi:ABC-type glycerol-3-phosphate transport system substrate-binding protein
MWVNYVNGIGTEASYANLQGSGQAAFFIDGKEVHGTWSRGASKADVLTYKTLNGKTVGLSPGQTWVELLNDGVPLTVTP